MELVRLGEPDRSVSPAGSADPGKETVSSTPFALSSGFQSLARIHLEGGRNTHSAALFEDEDACLLLVSDMAQIKLFRFRAADLTVLPPPSSSSLGPARASASRSPRLPRGFRAVPGAADALRAGG